MAFLFPGLLRRWLAKVRFDSGHCRQATGFGNWVYIDILAKLADACATGTAKWTALLDTIASRAPLSRLL